MRVSVARGDAGVAATGERVEVFLCGGVGGAVHFASEGRDHIRLSRPRVLRKRQRMSVGLFARIRRSSTRVVAARLRPRAAVVECLERRALLSASATAVTGTGTF